MRLTADTPLSGRFVERVARDMDAVTGHEYFRRASESALTLAQCRKTLLGFYPLIQAFPRYMRDTLARIDPAERERAGEARSWIARNVRTEARHARWWVDWGRGFGIAADEFARARPTEAMDAPNRYLAEVAAKASIAESVAAVNYALEGSAGIWTRAVRGGLSRQGEKLGFRSNARMLRWLEAHARYDDLHPIEALEVVKVYATSDADVDSAAAAASRCLRYLASALDDALAA
jgi:pyrroloquinoline quinone (PQQ) biosynthesis protein C